MGAGREARRGRTGRKDRKEGEMSARVESNDPPPPFSVADFFSLSFIPQPTTTTTTTAAELSSFQFLSTSVHACSARTATPGSSGSFARRPPVSASSLQSSLTLAALLLASDDGSTIRRTRTHGSTRGGSLRCRGTFSSLPSAFSFYRSS